MRLKSLIAFTLIIMIISVSFLSCAESATAALEEIYAQAELLMVQEKYGDAATQFEKLGTYSDSSQMAMYCKAIMAAESLQMYDLAIETFEKLGDFKDCKQMASYYSGRMYQAYTELVYSEIDSASITDLRSAIGNANQAISSFSALALFKDCMTRIASCNEMKDALLAKKAEREKEEAERKNEENEANYLRAIALEQKGDYEAALHVFNSLGNYKDTKNHIKACNEAINKANKDKENSNQYTIALELEQKRNYANALIAFEMIKDYRDSDEHIAFCKDMIEKHTYEEVGGIGGIMGIGSGLLNVKKGGKWGYIDLQGNIVIDFQYSIGYRFSCGVAWVENDKSMSVLINTLGEQVIPSEFEGGLVFNNGYSFAKRNGAWIKIDTSGKTVKTYDSLPTDEISASYKREIENNFKSKYPRGYFEVEIDGYATVMDLDTKKKGCINSKGEIVIPFEHDFIACGEGYFALFDDGYLTILDEEGNVVF